MLSRMTCSASLKNDDRYRLNQRYRLHEALGWVRCSCCQGGTHGGALSQHCRIIGRKAPNDLQTIHLNCGTSMDHLLAKPLWTNVFFLLFVTFLWYGSCWLLNMPSWQYTIPDCTLIVTYHPLSIEPLHHMSPLHWSWMIDMLPWSFAKTT